MRYFIKLLILLMFVLALNQKNFGQCGSIDLISDQYTLCQPAQFKWVLKNVPAGSVVSWDFGSGKQNGNDTFYALIDKAGKISLSVTISNTNGSVCTINRPDFVEVYSTPVPIFYSSQKKLCKGIDSITFFDVTPNSVSRNWSIEGNYYYNTQSKFNYKFKTPGIKKVSLVVEDNKGCIGIKDFDSTAIIYRQPYIDFAADILNGCINKPVIFTPNINMYGAVVSSTTWTFPGGQPFKQLQAIPDVVNYNVAGIFSPGLVIKTTGGCTYTLTKQDYQAYGTPAVLSLKISDTSVCIGKTITIENLDKSLPGTFSWTLNGASSVKQINPFTNLVNYNIMGKYDVAVTYNHNGCSVSQTLQKLIRVKDVKAGFVSTDNYHCKLPHTVHFTNQSKSYEPGALSYQWKIYDKGNLIHFTNKTNDSFALSKTGQYDVTLITLHSNGCQDTLSSKNFILNRKIAPDFGALYKLACINQTIRFTQNTPQSSYQAANKYKWTFYDKDTTTILGHSSLDNALFSYPDSGFYTIKMVADNGLGCKDSIRKREFIEIVKPIINFQLKDNIICKNDILHAIGNSSPTHANYRYFWYLKNKTNGSLIYKESPDFDQALDQAGQYDFKFVHQINTGCRDSIVDNNLVNSNGINAIIKLDTSNGCLPFKVKPVLNISENIHFGSGSNTVRYKWTASPGPGVTILYDTTPSPEFIFAKQGEYQIKAEVKNSVNCTQIIISQNIHAGVKADFLISDTLICSNQTIRIKDNSTLEPSGVKWILNNTAQTSDPLTNTILNVKFTKGGIYKTGLVANKYNMCFDTAYKTVRVISVKADLYALQTVMKCAPVYAKFVSRSKNADSLLWDFGDGNKIAGTDSFVANIYKKNSGAEIGFTLTLIAKSKEGCSDTMIKPNYMKIIGPVPGFSLKNVMGCTPVMVEFKNTNREVYKYYLNYDDGTSTDSLTLQHTYNLKDKNKILETYVPKMYATDILGCVAAFESSDTIKVYANPKSTFVLSDTIACENEAVKITNKTIRITNSWLYVIKSFSRVLLNQDSFVPNKKGSYEIIQIVKNSGNCYDSSHAILNVNPNPVANFLLTDTLCLSKEVNFKNISSSAYPITSVKWEIKNPLIPILYTTYDSKHTFQTIGPLFIKLLVTDSNNCQNSLSKNFTITDPITIPAGEIKMVSVNTDNSVKTISKPSGYYRFLFNNFYYKNSLIHSNLSKNGADFNTNLNAGQDSVCIDMTTVDVCAYETAKSIKHCTVFLKVVSQQAFTNQLNWTPYIGWPNVDGYSVYRKTQADNSFLLIKNLPGNILSLIDSGLCNSEYSYYIAAVYRDISSNSNISKSFPLFIYPALYSDIKNVSVSSDNSIEIKWQPSANSIFNYYSLYRTCMQSGKTDCIKLNVNTYLDKNVNTALYNYSYRIAETDKCGNSSHANLEGKTLLLEGVSSEYKSFLKWNTYKTWSSGVKKYILQLEKEGRFISLYNSMNSDSIFIHSQQLDNIHGPYCYRVMAVSGDDIDTSYSNIACLISPSTLFFPNAFSPNNDGTNEKIGARSLFVYNLTPIAGRNFSFEIYDRWGEKVFQSHDIDEEWDGNYRGKLVQQGIYTYRLKAEGLDYRSYNLKGTITILR